MARLAVPNEVSTSWQSFIWYVADVGLKAIILIEAGTVYQSMYSPATGVSTEEGRGVWRSILSVYNSVAICPR